MIVPVAKRERSTNLANNKNDHQRLSSWLYRLPAVLATRQHRVPAWAQLEISEVQRVPSSIVSLLERCRP